MLIKNKRGQIAIFVVLVFQFLFILFAMTINIALVVHDKINFQNSLDLAAYYGAKQQSEVLSAMAHINYQMRQNWKLLAWRYRILGTLLQGKGGGNDPNNYWCPQNDGSSSAPSYSCISNDCRLGDPAPNTQEVTQCKNSCDTTRTLPYGNYCDLNYFVCISNKVWNRGIGTSTQNLCIKKGVHIPSITDPISVGGLDPSMTVLVGTATDITNKLRYDANWTCPMEGGLNWLMTQIFLTHFRLDQGDRKTMLREIYKKTLQEGKDLDGKSIFEGAKKVFLKNLTEANKKNVLEKDPTNYGLEEFNSFEGKSFKYVFGHLNVWPVLRYADFGGNTISLCKVKTRSHYYVNGDYHSHWINMLNLFSNNNHGLFSFLKNDQRFLFSFNHANKFFNRDEVGDNPLASLTLGFYKKTDQTLYYGLKGDFDYLSKNQIFSLLLNPAIKFKASSFAKAFGGRFGPQPDQGDPFIPLHHPRGDPKIPPTAVLNSAFLQPNYSRWPGDRSGLLHPQLHSTNLNSHFLKKHYPQAGRPLPGESYYIEDFFHLIFYESPDDPLARPYGIPGPDRKKNFMRMMELMAVYPDAFDLSHYSIAGNYMKTYFPRICKLIREGGSDCQSAARNKINIRGAPFRAYIRGDFGWPETDYYMNLNQAKKGVDISVATYFLKANAGKIDPNEITHFKRNPVQPIQPLRLTSGKIFYPWLVQELPAHLLSSWAPTEERDRYFKYRFPKKKFLKCSGSAAKDMPVPSSCAIGGRSDYSVKLISCETVNDLDPKPGNIDEYCP